MATQVQWRGGSTAEHATFTGAAREVTVDTQKQTLVVHDGSTVGGEALLREDQANLPGSVTNGIYTPGADQVAVATNGSGRLFVDANGNVGIANSSPTNARLLVGDDLGAITTAARMVQVGHPSGGMLILGKDNTDYSYLTHEASTQTSNWFYRGGAGITLNSAGLVGVGTSSPSYKLHVVTDAISGRQDPTNISRTSGNLIRFTNPQFSTDASMGLLLRVFPDADSRQGAGIIANGGTNNGSTTLDLFYTDTAGTSKSGLRISDTGAVGIGVTSPSSILHLKAASSPKLILDNSDSSTDAVIDTWWAGTPLAFQIGSSEKARIDASGRLLIGTSSDLSGGDADARLQVNGDAGAQVLLSRQDFGALTAGTLIGEVVFRSQASGVSETSALIKCEADATQGSGDKPGRLVFSTTADGAGVPTERMRIANSGTIYGFSSDLGFWQAVSAAAGSSQLLFRGSHSGGAVGTGTTSYYVYSNGNVQNTNGSYTAISDAKLKENIVDASSQWDDLKSIQIRNWNFKAETGHETHRQIGPIAQELETVCPGLVFETPDRDADGNETGEVTKGVNQSVLYMKAVKALQEAIAKIETLEGMVAVNNITIDEQQHQLSTLAARLTALESA
jgi:hypothetical protein